jgi:hypothetical protein
MRFVRWHRRLPRRRRADDALITIVRPSLRHSDLPVADLFDDDAELVDTGGDTSEGMIGRLGWCPCQSEYTVVTRQLNFNARPNKAQIAAACANPPPPAAAEWKCPEDCVQVLTHVWHGWLLFKLKPNKGFLLNCSTFGQYHCKKPDDPDRNKPPHEGSPGPEL